MISQTSSYSKGFLLLFEAFGMMLKGGDYQTIKDRSIEINSHRKQYMAQGLEVSLDDAEVMKEHLIRIQFLQIYYLRASMNKNSLASIVYEKSLQRSHSQRLHPFSLGTKYKIISNNKKLTSMSQSHSNQLIKITQFDSGLHTQNRLSVPLGHSPHHTHSAPAYRHFTVKKLKDIKLPCHPSTSMVIDLKLQDKQSYTSKYAKPVNKIDSQPNKILITSKWKFRQDLWDIGTLGTQENQCQSVVVVKPQTLEKKEARSNSRGNMAKKKEPKENSKTTCSKERFGYTTAEWPHITSSRDKEDFIKRVCESPRKKYVEEQKRYQENIEKQKKVMLQTRKELNKNYAKPFSPPENVSAFAYIIYETDPKKKSKLRKLSAKKKDQQSMAEIRKLFLNSHKVVVSLNSRTAVQIASLTKIMTCITAIDISKRFDLRLDQQSVVIGAFEQNIGGTSANIKKGEVYSVYQLLHGLMLPSGNDASLAVAVWGGRVLLERGTINQGSKTEKLKKKECYDRFICEMNQKALSLNMQKTKYCNSHGLSNPENRSCCFDLGILSEYAMSDPLFREIVGCRVFESEIKILSDEPGSYQKLALPAKLKDNKKDFRLKCSLNALSMDEKNAEFEEMKDMEDNIVDDNLEEEEQPCGLASNYMQVRQIRWENTHQLLQKRPQIYTGIKTGVTTTAGPCLASCLEVKGRKFIIIVLNCKSMKNRMKDTQTLRKWLYNKEGISAEHTADS